MKQNPESILTKKLFTLGLAIMASCTLVSCANLSRNTIDKKTLRALSQAGEVVIHDDSILFKGHINDINNQKLFRLFELAQRAPKTLTITSGGGLIESGLELGEWIIEKELDVHIPQECISSCANYVFTAGRQVTLGEKAVVSWHGSPLIDDLLEGTPDEEARWKGVRKSLSQVKPELKNQRRYWNDIRSRNRRFFRTIGVHPAITSLVVVADDSSSAKIRQARSWKWYAAYISIEDMKYFGVTNVRVEDDRVWRPELNHRLKFELVKVTLDQDVEKKLAEITRRLNHAN